MFVRHADASMSPVTVFIDGRECLVPDGISVAAALLLAGHVATGRSAVTGRPRGPWCLMGTCFGCLVDIDGVADLRACMSPVRDRMRIVLAVPAAGVEATREADPWNDAP